MALVIFWMLVTDLILCLTVADTTMSLSCYNMAGTYIQFRLA